MTPKQFQKFLVRDGHCLHCGLDDDTLIPQHRKNRGMGGSKLLNTPSNVIVLCSRFNLLIESDFVAAKLAKANGWKLSAWDDPAVTPVFDFISQKWFVLDEKFGRTDVTRFWG